jgi:hypothetical protein
VTEGIVLDAQASLEQRALDASDVEPEDLEAGTKREALREGPVPVGPEGGKGHGEVVVDQFTLDLDVTELRPDASMGGRFGRSSSKSIVPVALRSTEK